MTETIKYRRKRAGKTNYKKRLTLLKSGKKRLVIRRTNTQIIAQIVKYVPEGDNVLCAVNSAYLKKLGWSYGAKSIPSAYLTGKMLSARSKEKKASNGEIILDLGLHTPAKGSRIYAVVKGAIDAGMNIKVSEETFPAEDRILGKHIIEHHKKNPKQFRKAESIDAYEKKFEEISKKIQNNLK